MGENHDKLHSLVYMSHYVVKYAFKHALKQNKRFDGVFVY